MRFDLFKSDARDLDGLSGVFERDEDTAYFYLYDSRIPNDKKILGAINVSERLQNVSETEISIKLNADQTHVRLYSRDELIASFRLPETR